MVNSDKHKKYYCIYYYPLTKISGDEILNQIASVVMSLSKGEKVFITGATGFVGSNLARRYLGHGAEVYINVRKTSDTWRIDDILRDVNIVPVDITDFEKLRDSLKKIQPCFIFHTAAYGGNAAQKNPEKIIASNIAGTLNIVRCCRDINVDLLVNTGSSSEYGMKNSPMKETDLLEPVTEYGASKAAATLYCQTYARTEKIPVITLRLFSPYGSYEQKSRLIPSVILAALQKKNPKISSRQFVRDFIYIEDVLSAYDAALDLTDASGKIFNIGSGNQYSVGEVVDIIIRLLGNDVSYETGIPQAWKNEPATWKADIKKAKTELFWEPEYSLEQGLLETINWFKDHAELYQK
jgi:nucleoside-diphosphate-sugar epimerase